MWNIYVCCLLILYAPSHKKYSRKAPDPGELLSCSPRDHHVITRSPPSDHRGVICPTVCRTVLLFYQVSRVPLNHQIVGILFYFFIFLLRPIDEKSICKSFPMRFWFNGLRDYFRTKCVLLTVLQEYSNNDPVCAFLCVRACCNFVREWAANFVRALRPA